VPEVLRRPHRQQHAARRHPDARRRGHPRAAVGSSLRRATTGRSARRCSFARVLARSPRWRRSSRPAGRVHRRG